MLTIPARHCPQFAPGPEPRLRPGIQALGPPEGVRRVLAALPASMISVNDLRGRTRLRGADVGGRRISFKHDYYEGALRWYPPGASDLAVTERMLTIM